MFDFITSDTHFHHHTIIGLGERPFGSVVEMNTTLVNNWNRVVQPHHRVLHLGDFAHDDVPVEALRDVRAQLNGHISLALGNHDLPENLVEAGVISLSDLRMWYRTPDKSVTFSHLPLEPALLYRGLVSVHGHTHGPRSLLDPELHSGAISVNCELHDYTPIAWARLEQLIAEAKRAHPTSWADLHG